MNLDSVRSQLDHEAGKNPSIIGARNLRLRFRDCLKIIVDKNLMFTKTSISGAYDLAEKELAAANIALPSPAFKEALLKNLGRV
mgnify:CR=1 FL=1